MTTRPGCSTSRAAISRTSKRRVATSATPAEVIGTMRAKYPGYGNVPTLLAAAYSQYPADGQ